EKDFLLNEKTSELFFREMIHIIYYGLKLCVRHLFCYFEINFHNLKLRRIYNRIEISFQKGNHIRFLLFINRNNFFYTRTEYILRSFVACCTLTFSFEYFFT